MSTNQILSTEGNKVNFFLHFPALNTVKYERKTGVLFLHITENNKHGINTVIPNCKAPLI